MTLVSKEIIPFMNGSGAKPKQDWLRLVLDQNLHLKVFRHQEIIPGPAICDNYECKRQFWESNASKYHKLHSQKRNAYSFVSLQFPLIFHSLCFCIVDKG